MAQKVIDLRSGEGRRKEASLSTPSIVPKEEPQKIAPGGQIKNLIQWSALEHEKKERGPYWFMVPGVAALILVLFGILTRSYFFAAFVSLAFTVLVMYVQRGPQKATFVISKEGLAVGSKLYPYSDLRSFWIFDRPHLKELSFETKRILTPFIRIPLGEVETATVRNFLLGFLEEAEHKEFVSDQVARGLGF